MTIGLHIKQDGDFVYFNYIETDFLNRFINIIENRGVGQIECFHDIEQEGLMYLFYGWTVGYNNFNRFEFQTHTVYGDAIIIAVNRELEIRDINMDNIEACFTQEDLDDTLLEDELEPEDEYDFDDSFIASEDEDELFDYDESFSDDD